MSSPRTMQNTIVSGPHARATPRSMGVAKAH